MADGDGGYDYDYSYDVGGYGGPGGGGSYDGSYDVGGFAGPGGNEGFGDYDAAGITFDFAGIYDSNDDIGWTSFDEDPTASPVFDISPLYQYEETPESGTNWGLVWDIAKGGLLGLAKGGPMGGILGGLFGWGMNAAQEATGLEGLQALAGLAKGMSRGTIGVFDMANAALSLARSAESQGFSGSGSEAAEGKDSSIDFTVDQPTAKNEAAKSSSSSSDKRTIKLEKLSLAPVGQELADKTEELVKYWKNPLGSYLGEVYRS